MNQLLKARAASAGSAILMALSLATSAVCQVSRVPPLRAVANLGTCAPTGLINGPRFVIATDGADATDCTVGGGSTAVPCWCDGTQWTVLAGGGGGGPDTTCLDAGVDCLFAGSASEGGPATSALDLSCSGCVADAELALVYCQQGGTNCPPDDAGTDDQTAPEVPYTPAVGADWVDPDPTTAAVGLDQLADRLTVEEAKPDDTGTDTLDDLSDNALGDLGNVSEVGAGVGVPLVGDGAGAWEPAGAAAILEGDARLSDARAPTFHASTHRHGGGDEVATATPGANAIPKAGAGGKLDDGWLSSNVSFEPDADTAAGKTFSGTGTALVTTAGVQTSGDCVEIDGAGNHVASGATCGGGVSDHGALTGLTDDDHTQYALLAGRTGQTLYGGAGAHALNLQSTSATATPSYGLLLNSSGVAMQRATATKLLVTSDNAYTQIASTGDGGLAIRQDNSPSGAPSGGAIGIRPHPTSWGPTSGNAIGILLGSAYPYGDSAFAPSSGTANYRAVEIRGTINQSGTASGDYSLISGNVTETSFLGSLGMLLNLKVGGVQKFGVDNAGSIYTAGTKIVDLDAAAVTTRVKRVDSPQSVTCTDSGDGSPGAVVITPTTSYVELTNADPHGCLATMSETGADAGQVVEIVIVSNAGGTIDFTDSAGVLNIAGDFLMALDDGLSLRYSSAGLWVERYRSNN